jgi:hypothetical protein
MPHDLLCRVERTTTKRVANAEPGERRTPLHSGTSSKSTSSGSIRIDPERPHFEQLTSMIQSVPLFRPAPSAGNTDAGSGE